MELRHLQYFVAVATELNFTRAAEKLMITQPALSTQVADLEREIGTPLLFRNKRVVRLTAAGDVFLDDAKAILAKADAAKARALRASRGEVGELSIGFFTAPTLHFLPELIRKYRAEYPSVTIRMRELTPNRQLTSFARNEIDIGFTRPLPPGHSELTTQILFRERLLAVVPGSHRLAARRRIKLSDLSSEHFVLLDRQVAIGMHDGIIAACRSSGFSPSMIDTPDLITTVLTMVSSEQGVSIVPESVKNLRSENVSFLPVSPMLEPIPLIMCWKTSSDRPPAKAFRAMVQEQTNLIRRDYAV
tara:strand:+ start:131537 stop:132445 length:909 start_codon:yes stop_codon:yes gene_type:complete